MRIQVAGPKAKVETLPGAVKENKEHNLRQPTFEPIETERSMISSEVAPKTSQELNLVNFTKTIVETRETAISANRKLEYEWKYSVPKAVTWYSAWRLTEGSKGNRRTNKWMKVWHLSAGTSNTKTRKRKHRSLPDPKIWCARSDLSLRQSTYLVTPPVTTTGKVGQVPSNLHQLTARLFLCAQPNEHSKLGKNFG